MTVAQPSEMPLGGKTILVVEDEYMIASDLKESLSRMGARVIGPVARASQARSLIESDPPDGIMLDINLNGADSWDLAEHIVAKGIPLVIATGYATIPESLAGVPYLQKPHTERQLREATRATFVSRDRQG